MNGFKRSKDKALLKPGSSGRCVVDCRAEIVEGRSIVYS